MQQAFVYNEVAVLVRHWFEISSDDSHLEHGARIEVRQLARQPHRGTDAAAQQVVVDHPMWRADLFDRLDGTPGGLEAAHFHPHFLGVEPSDRHWADEVRKTPWEWLLLRLSDVADIAATAGLPLRAPAVERAQVQADAPAIVVAAQRRAGAECRSPQQCFEWTRDATHSVRLKLDTLVRPELLDRDHVAPWMP